MSGPVSGEELEELIVEREPIIGRHRDVADDGSTMSGEQHEMVLRAERPLVEWEALAVDHARLGTGSGFEEDCRRRGRQGGGHRGQRG